MQMSSTWWREAKGTGDGREGGVVKEKEKRLEGRLMKSEQTSPFHPGNEVRQESTAQLSLGLAANHKAEFLHS